MSRNFKRPVSQMPNANLAMKQTRAGSGFNTNAPMKVEGRLNTLVWPKLVKLEGKDFSSLMVSSGLNLLLTSQSIVSNINKLISPSAPKLELKNFILAQKYKDIYEKFKKFPLRDFMLDLFKLIPEDFVYIKENSDSKQVFPRGNKIEIILELNLQVPDILKCLIDAPQKFKNEYNLSSMTLCKKCMIATFIRVDKEFKLILPFKVLEFSNWQDLVIMLIELELSPCVIVYTKANEGPFNFNFSQESLDYITNLSQKSINSASTSDVPFEETKQAPIEVVSVKPGNSNEQKLDKLNLGGLLVSSNVKFSAEKSRRNELEGGSLAFIEKFQEVKLKPTAAPTVNKVAPVRATHDSETDKRQAKAPKDPKKEKQNSKEIFSPLQKLNVNEIKAEPNNVSSITLGVDKSLKDSNVNLQKPNDNVQPQNPIKMWNCVKCNTNNYFTEALCQCGHFNINLNAIMNLPLTEKSECEICSGYSISNICEKCKKDGYYKCSICLNISMQSNKCVYCKKPEEKYRPQSMKPNFNSKNRK